MRIEQNNIVFRLLKLDNSTLRACCSDDWTNTTRQVSTFHSCQRLSSQFNFFYNKIVNAKRAFHLRLYFINWLIFANALTLCTDLYLVIVKSQFRLNINIQQILIFVEMESGNALFRSANREIRAVNCSIGQIAAVKIMKEWRYVCLLHSKREESVWAARVQALRECRTIVHRWYKTRCVGCQRMRAKRKPISKKSILMLEAKVTSNGTTTESTEKPACWAAEWWRVTGYSVAFPMMLIENEISK